MAFWTKWLRNKPERPCLPRNDDFHQPLEVSEIERIFSHGIRSSQWVEPSFLVSDLLADDWEITEG